MLEKFNPAFRFANPCNPALYSEGWPEGYRYNFIQRERFSYRKTSTVFGNIATLRCGDFALMSNIHR